LTLRVRCVIRDTRQDPGKPQGRARSRGAIFSRVQNPTPETIRKVLNLSEVFDVVATSSQVRVQAPRYFGSTRTR
jgi:hypothetical protein